MNVYDIAIARALSSGGGGGGGSDFTIASVTVTGGSINATPMPICMDYSGQGAPFDYVLECMNVGRDEGVYQVPLYKGYLLTEMYALEGESISVSGNITEAFEGVYLITGDCTITIS